MSVIRGWTSIIQSSAFILDSDLIFPIDLASARFGRMINRGVGVARDRRVYY